MLTTSKEVKNITAALIEARKKFPKLKKDKEGYGYNYTDLSTVIDSIVNELLANNIMVLQPLSDNNPKEEATITTRLQHESGEYIESQFRMPIPSMKSNTNAQEFGAAVTYGRRYAIASMLFISSEEDTDCANKNNKSKNNNGNGNGETNHALLSEKRNKIKLKILKNCSGDSEKAKALLKSMTSYEFQGTQIEGKTSVNDLSEKQIEFLLRRLNV
jgi:hypothetical protein